MPTDNVAAPLWDGIEPRRWLAHYICSELTGPCDDTCLRIADRLLAEGVTLAAPLGAAPTEAAIDAAMAARFQPTNGVTEPNQSVRPTVEKMLRAAYVIDGGRPVLPEGDRAAEEGPRDCPMCGDPGGYGHVCPERSN